jgi:hypothetical protein
MLPYQIEKTGTTIYGITTLSITLKNVTLSITLKNVTLSITLQLSVVNTNQRTLN